MRSFEHVNATSVQEAVKLLSVQNARVIGGGTDLLAVVKDGLLPTARIVNLKTIPGLDQIKADGEGVRIGALARLADIAGSTLVKERAPSVAAAAALVASPQIRNAGTIGGNIAQKGRCWYYRDADRADCYKRNGSFCYAVFGQSDLHAIFDGAACFAVTPSDTAVALTSVDAEVVVVGPKGERIVPATSFFIGPDKDYMREVDLAQDEIITEIRIPGAFAKQPSVFLKAAPRRAIDFARASVAATVVGGAQVVKSRVVLGGVSAVPKRALGAEAYLEGKRLTSDVIAKAAELATEGAKPLANNAYKIRLTQGLVRQALTRLAS